MDLALNNQQWLICYKTKPNETKSQILKMKKIRVEWNIFDPF